MKSEIKNAFDNVHAEESLKQSTGKYLINKTNNYRRKNLSKPLRVGLSFACAAVITSSVTGYHMYFTPVSAISLDVNPSVELNINRFDKVVSVKTYNNDGQKLVESVNLKYMDYSSALEKLMTSDDIEQYIEKGEEVSITVSVDNEEKRAEMMSEISSCEYANQKGVNCSSGNNQYHDEAQSAGLSTGKYKAYLELKELDPSITIDDVKDLTMRQICDMIGGDYSQGDNSNKSNCTGRENCHGNGECGG